MIARDWARQLAQTCAQTSTKLARAGAVVVLVGAICALTDGAHAARKEKPAQAGSEGEKAPSSEAEKKKLTPAEAQAALDAAVKLLEAGKAEPAAQALTSILAGGRLPPAVMAKTLFYRGMAYRQQKKPAQAIADLTSALWLKGGLAEADRADALKQRAAAYEEAGLTDSGATVAAAVPHGAPPAPHAAPSATWGGSTSASLAPAATPSAAPSSSGWNFFSDLFGASSTATPPAPTAAAAAPIAPPDAPAGGGGNGAPIIAPTAATKTSGWTRNTQVHGGAPQIETATLPVKPEGRFRIQLGMARTRDQAQAMAVKVKSRYGDAVGQREPEIDEAVIGNMGSFYRVRVGPFASPQEGQAACTKLKGSGFDCLVVAQ